MPITTTQQKKFEEIIHLLNTMELEDWASLSFSDKEFRLILIKTIATLIPDSINLKSNWSDESILFNSKFEKTVLEETFLKAVKAATTPSKPRVFKFKGVKSSEVRGYSTGQLASFFGVSTTTINNWINEGRFLQELENGQMTTVVRKSINEKLKIHPETWFDAPSGVRYQVKEAAEAFEKDLEEWEASKQANTVTEQEQIQSYLEHFKNKYHGKDFSEVFGNKDWNNITAEEESDAAMWSFFLQRISNDQNTRD